MLVFSVLVALLAVAFPLRRLRTRVTRRQGRRQGELSPVRGLGEEREEGAFAVVLFNEPDHARLHLAHVLLHLLQPVQPPHDHVELLSDTAVLASFELKFLNKRWLRPRVCAVRSHQVADRPHVLVRWLLPERRVDSEPVHLVVPRQHILDDVGREALDDKVPRAHALRPDPVAQRVGNLALVWPSLAETEDVAPEAQPDVGQELVLGLAGFDVGAHLHVAVDDDGEKEVEHEKEHHNAAQADVDDDARVLGVLVR
mmetsp:Transcript_25011/g.59582  ORF Transcript_25011/g.59582 Transcript_25011/m.59582 type:complete len:256 (+) Transcript_25011:367-1134(+)